MVLQKKTAAFINSSQAGIDAVYTAEQQKRLAGMCDFLPGCLTQEDVRAGKAAKVHFLFSTWGMPALTEEEIGKMPELHTVFYGAGATDFFARPFLKKGIHIVSAWRMNAIPVAEFCLAEILLALKGFYRVTKAFRRHADWEPARKLAGPGIYGETVALIGAGSISTLLKEMLEKHKINVVVVPSRPERRTLSITEVFRQAYVISNHLPDRSDNVKTIGRAEFEAMRPGAVFINTGRGAQVDEEALADVLVKRPDLTAILDVTSPEPPEDDSPLFRLPNVWLTPHVAGSLNDEVHRMSECMIGELENCLAQRPFRHEVTEEMLLTSK